MSSYLTANFCKTTNSRTELKSAGILSADGYLEYICIYSNCLKTVNAANSIALITILKLGHHGLKTLWLECVYINSEWLSKENHRLKKHWWGRRQFCQTWNREYHTIGRAEEERNTGNMNTNLDTSLLWSQIRLRSFSLYNTFNSISVLQTTPWDQKREQQIRFLASTDTISFPA